MSVYEVCCLIEEYVDLNTDIIDDGENKSCDSCPLHHVLLPLLHTTDINSFIRLH